MVTKDRQGMLHDKTGKYTEKRRDIGEPVDILPLDGINTDNRNTLTSRTYDEASSAVVALLFDSGETLYIKLAKSLINALLQNYRNNENHWLCQMLNRAAKTIDPGTYTAIMEKGVAALLEQKKVSPFVAEVIGKSAAFSIDRFVGDLGLNPLILGLHATVALVCPDLSNCPTLSDTCTGLLVPKAPDILRSVLASAS